MAFRLLPADRRLSWMPYAWLAYALPFLATAFYAPLGPGRRVAVILAFAVFLGAYFGSYWIRGRRIYLVAAVHDALGAAFTWWNPAAATFFIYAAASFGGALPPREAAVALAGQVLATTVFGFATGLPSWFYLPATLLSALIGAVNIQSAVNRAKDARLQLAHDEVARLAKFAERERIARDLHDLLGHTLSVVALKAELARTLVPHDQARAVQEIADVEQAARAGLAEVRAAIAGYRSVGFFAELANVRRTLADAGLVTRVEAPEGLPLPPAEEAALALALREAATNVIRHAHATEVRIRLEHAAGVVVLEIADDGRGGQTPLGHGLTGMRERITALGGDLVRQSDRGTRLRITLPLPAGTP